MTKWCAMAQVNEENSLACGLRTGFVGADSTADDRWSPKVIANNKSKGSDLLTAIKEQLSTCDSFDFCVAFIADSGLQPFVEVFSELRRRGVRGRLLTSTYLNFNSPDAFRKLLEYDNIDVRIYQGNLHVKGYVFDPGDTSTVIVGSSNLTQMALTCNREWNILFRSFGAGGMLRSIKEEFAELGEVPRPFAFRLVGSPLTRNTEKAPRLQRSASPLFTMRPTRRSAPLARRARSLRTRCRPRPSRHSLRCMAAVRPALFLSRQREPARHTSPRSTCSQRSPRACCSWPIGRES